MVSIKAKASLSQNFLTNKRIISKIVAAADLTEKDNILEIGAGKGDMTSMLLKHCRMLIAVELDNRLCSHLEMMFQNDSRFKLVNDDICKVDWQELLTAGRNWKLVANIPYHISSQIFFKLVYNRHSFSQIVMMFQKEFGQKILADPDGKNSKQVGALSVASKLCFDTKKLFTISGGSFLPPASVDSIVISFRPKKPVVEDENSFFRFVQQMFCYRRKTILNGLKLNFEQEIWLKKVLQQYVNKRPQQLTMNEWKQFFSAVKN